MRKSVCVWGVCVHHVIYNSKIVEYHLQLYTIIKYPPNIKYIDRPNIPNDFNMTITGILHLQARSCYDVDI